MSKRDDVHVRTTQRENVIQLSDRRGVTEDSEDSRSSRLRMRLDMEHAKIAISTSLISVVVLVTFANNSIWSVSPSVAVAIPGDDHGFVRGLASVASSGAPEVEAGLARRLAVDGLADNAGVGRVPSSLDQLALGFLEGKYSLRLEQGKLHGLEFSSDSSSGDSPKFVDRVRFLEQHRDLLPVAFDRLTKAAIDDSGVSAQVESYELLRDGNEAPLARVEFRLDRAGRLLSMKVRLQRVAAL